MRHDVSHVPRTESPFIVEHLSSGKIEVRRNSPARELLGEFTSMVLVELFTEALTDLCGEELTMMGANRAA